MRSIDAYCKIHFFSCLQLGPPPLEMALRNENIPSLVNSHKCFTETSTPILQDQIKLLTWAHGIQSSLHRDCSGKAEGPCDRCTRNVTVPAGLFCWHFPLIQLVQLIFLNSITGSPQYTKPRDRLSLHCAFAWKFVDLRTVVWSIIKEDQWVSQFCLYRPYLLSYHRNWSNNMHITRFKRFCMQSNCIPTSFDGGHHHHHHQESRR